MADTPIYSHSEIRRYLQHKMTPQEMHDFEKALMNDPFLADALEGFSESDNALAEKHLFEIESRLKNEKQEGRVVSMPLQKAAWWKVAAVVLVVATCGVLTYSVVTKKGDEKNIAQQMPSSEAKEMAAKTDSIGPAEKPLAQVEVLPKRVPVKKHKIGSPIIREEKEEPSVPALTMQMKADTPRTAMTDKSEEVSALMHQNARATAALNAPANFNADNAAESKKMAMSSAVSKYEFEGRIADADNKPVAANIIAQKNHIRTTADTNGYFKLKAKDSVLLINANALGYVPTALTIKKDSPVNIILNNRTQTLSEVVVTALNQKKKKNAFRQSENIKKDAEPKGGWNNFEHYLNAQVDSIKANDINNDYAEKIELEFSTNKVGRPINIKALENADSLTAEKAIQILMNGPEWKNKKKEKKIKIIIPFE